MAGEVELIIEDVFNEPCNSCKGTGYYEDRKYKVPVKCNCLAHRITKTAKSIEQYIQDREDNVLKEHIKQAVCHECGKNLMKDFIKQALEHKR